MFEGRATRYYIDMNNTKRPAFHMILDGRDALTTVYGWKNLRAYIARQEAKGHVVGYHY
ncbi:hypothetical protein PBI_ARROYO_47 [Microbacterium phage Arroyo]|uniref:hypothetical protein n=1 Tax=Microbacterium phage Arroyo TaxID=2591213 RepID=UPI001162858D|nr:hypothetical protein QDW24_gp47 [Microbacterium phage Arroyo]QDH93463.1 hypothetical protein PBI_ARROYO_47 [Microbacterium phage Arroyo]